MLYEVITDRQPLFMLRPCAIVRGDRVFYKNMVNTDGCSIELQVRYRLMSNDKTEPAELVWHAGDIAHRVVWHSEAGVPPPRRVVVADDTLTADTAYRFACEGTAMLWRGDFQNARQSYNFV